MYARGCKVQVRYVKSKKAKNTVLAQSRKAGKKLGYRAVVQADRRDEGDAPKKVSLHVLSHEPKGPAASERPGPSYARP